MTSGMDAARRRRAVRCGRRARGDAWALLALAVACKSGSDRTAGATIAPAMPIDVAAVNALVPAALKDRLVFERREIVIERGQHRTTYALAAPRSWTQRSKVFAHLRADDPASPFTRFEVGSNCDGECSPKPWQDIADRVNFAPRIARGKVAKDEPAAGRRTLIAEVESGGAKTTDVVIAWWKDGAKNYHTCTALLGEAWKDAAPAFERACQAVEVDGSD